MKKLTQIKSNTNALMMTWFINNICTNHCTYCPPVLNNGTNHNYDWQHARSFLIRLMDRYEKINCILMGGEPTVSPFLNEAIDMMHSRGHSVALTSNGVRSVQYWQNIAPKISTISFSYHPSYGIKDFFEKVKVISQHTIIGVRIMFDSRHWDETIAFYNQCIAIPYLRVEAVRILPEISGGHIIGADYTEQQLAWLSTAAGRPSSQSHAVLKKQNPKWEPFHGGSSFHYDDESVELFGDANNLISMEQTFFNGWACSIGIESMYINYNGQVRKGNCRQGPDLFHLDDHANHPLPSEGEICMQGRCTCPTDIRVSKFPVVQNGVSKPYPMIPLVQQ